MKKTFLLTVTVAAATIAGVPGLNSGVLASDSVTDARNRLVVEAHRDGNAAIPMLVEALDDEHEDVRLTAARLLVHLDAPDEAFEEGLAAEDTEVRRVIAGGIGSSGRVIDFVEPLVLDSSAVIRRDFYLNLMPRYLLEDGRTPTELIDALASAFSKADTEFQVEIAEAMCELPFDGEVPEQVITFLTSEYHEVGPEVRSAIIETLSELPMTESSSALLRELAETGEDEQAVEALKAIAESKVEDMGRLADNNKWQELIDSFGGVDIDQWPDMGERNLFGRGHESTSPAAEGHFWRGMAYYNLERGEEAAEEFDKSLARDPKAGHNRAGRFRLELLSLAGSNALEHLDDKARAADIYAEAYGLAGPLWRSMILVLDAVDLLCDLDRCDDALDLFEDMDHDRLSDLENPWRFQYRYFVSYARVLEAAGRREEARLQYERALEMDDLSDGQEKNLKEALGDLDAAPDEN